MVYHYFNMNIISNKKYTKSELFRLIIKRANEPGKLEFRKFLSTKYKGVSFKNESFLFKTSSNALEFERIDSIDSLLIIPSKEVFQYIQFSLDELDVHRNFLISNKNGVLSISDTMFNTTKEIIKNKNKNKDFELMINSESFYRLYISNKSLSVDSKLFIFKEKIIIISNIYLYIIKKIK